MFVPPIVWSNAMQACWMAAEAHAVLSMRMMGMVGAWSLMASDEGKGTDSAKAETRDGASGLVEDDRELAHAQDCRPCKGHVTVKRVSRRGPKVRR